MEVFALTSRNRETFQQILLEQASTVLQMVCAYTSVIENIDPGFKSYMFKRIYLNPTGYSLLQVQLG